MLKVYFLDQVLKIPVDLVTRTSKLIMLAHKVSSAQQNSVILVLFKRLCQICVLSCVKDLGKLCMYNSVLCLNSNIIGYVPEQF
jgi:hypothetical protein